MKARTFYLVIAFCAFGIGGGAFRAARHAQLHQTVIPSTQEFPWLSPAQAYAVAVISLVFAMYALYGFFRSGSSSMIDVGH